MTVNTYVRFPMPDGTLQRFGGDPDEPEPPTLNGVGLIGDGLTYQSGSTGPRDAFIAEGWPNDTTTRVDGLASRNLGMPGAVSPDVGEVIDAWRADNFDPDRYVIALGHNNLGNTDQQWSDMIKAILDKVAAGERTSYKVYWVLLVLRRDPAPTVTNATQATIDRFQAVVESLIGYNSKIDLIPLDLESHIYNGRSQTGLWDLADTNGKFMTTAGYNLRNAFVAELTPIVPQNIKFPGYLSGSDLYWGINEFDQDPMDQSAGEEGAPEALTIQKDGSGNNIAGTGVRVACIRKYWNENLTPGALSAGGALYDFCVAQHNKGRIPWVSVKYPNWGVQDDGRNNAAWDRFIAWCEETATKPVWFAIFHEPENNTVSHGGTSGTELEWFQMSKAFRARMTVYADAHAPTDGSDYKWKNLAFTCILTAYSWTRTASQSAAAVNYIRNPDTERIFDMVGADYYVWSTTAPTWGAAAQKFVAWGQLHNYPLGFGEWGVQRTSGETVGGTVTPTMAKRIQDFYDLCCKPEYDIVVAQYFNSSEGHFDGPRQWILENTAINGNGLTKYVNLIKATTSKHFWDVRRPDGGNYSRPTGAVFP